MALVHNGFWYEVSRLIREEVGKPFNGVPAGGVGGGCINQAVRLEDSSSGACYFVKLNRAELLDMFSAEAAGLRAIAATQTIRVPLPICEGQIGERAFLVLTWLDLAEGGGDWRRMGIQLAEFHRAVAEAGFGWSRDNFIGSTPQPNPRNAQWETFFTEHRLGFQLRLARDRGGRLPRAERLLKAVPLLLANHAVQPALVHGDLWSGNASFTRDEEPVIYDPAVYHGDPEVDLAMSRLFGGFPATFYAGYHEVLPRRPGSEERAQLYNLYHILNHFNLFGGSYLAQANQMIDSLLAKT